MNRVSTDMFNNDMQYHLRRRESELSTAQNKISAQTRILSPKDDPIGTAHATRYQSQTVRLERFTDNVNRLRDSQNVAEGYLREGLDILQRIREIAVQGANGIYTGEDLSYMAREVDELLSELVNISNARSGDGTSLFSGDVTKSDPFEIVRGHAAGGLGELIQEVNYSGSITRNLTEISEGRYIEANFPGNRVFWAENQQVYSTVDASTYQVQNDSVIRIDGTGIELKAGDSIHSVVYRINNSGASVKASIDPVGNSLVLQTTSPHQLWVEDAAGSSVLRDLGIIGNTGSRPPKNFAPDARVYGGSAFDMIIRLRDSLLSGDSEEVGGRALSGIDQALNNFLGNIAELGAKGERLEITGTRLSRELLDVQTRASRETDLDMAQAITDLRMIEYAHQAALQTAARVLKPTLLDYLE